MFMIGVSGLTRRRLGMRDACLPSRLPALGRAGGDSQRVRQPSDRQGERCYHDEVQHGQDDPGLKISNPAGDSLPSLPDRHENILANAFRHTFTPPKALFLSARLKINTPASSPFHSAPQTRHWLSAHILQHWCASYPPASPGVRTLRWACREVCRSPKREWCIRGCAARRALPRHQRVLRPYRHRREWCYWEDRRIAPHPISSLLVAVGAVIVKRALVWDTGSQLRIRTG